MNDSQPGTNDANNVRLTQARRQVGRFLLMVAVIAVVIGLVIVYRTVTPDTYRISLDPGEMPESDFQSHPYDPRELLAEMDYRLEFDRGRGSVELMQWRADPTRADRRTGTFEVRGDERDLVRGDHLVGYLQWKGADPGKLEIELEDFERLDDRHLLQTLGWDRLSGFYDAEISTLVKILDADGAPQEAGLEDDDLQLQELVYQDPAWTVAVTVYSLLSSLEQGRDTLSFHADAVDRQNNRTPVVLRIPVREFIHDDPAFVITLTELTPGSATALCPLPSTASLRPANVRRGAWDGHLSVTGEFLDQTETAVLVRGSRRHSCEIDTQTEVRLELSAPTSLPAGRYTLLLQKDGCEDETAGWLRINDPAPSLSAASPPVTGHRVSAGDELTLRWQRDRVGGPLVLWIAPAAGGGDRARLADIPADLEQYTPDLGAVGPGEYRISLLSEEQTGITPVTWNLTIDQPHSLLVALAFRKGSGSWRGIRQAWIDDKLILDGEWQGNTYNARVRLTPGRHHWQVEDRDGMYSGEFAVPGHDEYPTEVIDALVRITYESAQDNP